MQRWTTNLCYGVLDMSLKMEITRKLLKAKKDSMRKRLTNTEQFNSIYDILEINDHSRSAPNIIKKIALRNLRTTEIKLANVNCVMFEPKNTKYFANTKIKNDHCLIYIHGGGFISGLALQGTFFIKAFMREVGIKTIAINYSLSPEVLFPTALNQIYDVYKELLKTFSHNKIIVCGESAGANLALALMLKIRKNKIPQPKMAILASGYFDLANSGESYILNEDSDPLLTKKQVAFMSTAYIMGNKVKLLSPDDTSNPLISPIYANLAGLPPLFISACSDELLYSDSQTIYNNCLRDNVKAKFHVSKNCFHAYLIMGNFFYESKIATKECCKFVKEIFKF